MDERLKQRAVGGVVIVALLVIFVPMFLDFSEDGQEGAATSVVPPQPQAEMQTLEIPLADLQERQVADGVPPGTESPEQILAEAMDAEVMGDIRPQAEANPDQVLDPLPPQALSEMSPTPPPPPAAAKAPSPPPAKAPASSTAKAPAPAKAPQKLAAAPPPKSKIAEPKPKLAGPTTGSKAWAVQVGSFTKRESAEKLRDRLRKSGYRAFVTSAQAAGKTVVRVRVGPELERADADQLRKRIEKDLQLQAKVVVHP